jgi:hypothetical protein
MDVQITSSIAINQYMHCKVLNKNEEMDPKKLHNQCPCCIPIGKNSIKFSILNPEI